MPYLEVRDLQVERGGALAVRGVHAVLTHEDVPGPNRYGVAVLDQRQPEGGIAEQDRQVDYEDY